MTAQWLQIVLQQAKMASPQKARKDLKVKVKTE
jgi:hypothetical protein